MRTTLSYRRSYQQMVKILLPPGAESLGGGVKGVGSFTTTRGYTIAQIRGGNRRPNSNRLGVSASLVIGGRITKRIKSNTIGFWDTPWGGLERDQVYATTRLIPNARDWANNFHERMVGYGNGNAPQDDNLFIVWDTLFNVPQRNAWHEVGQRWPEIIQNIDIEPSQFRRGLGFIAFTIAWSLYFFWNIPPIPEGNRFDYLFSDPRIVWPR